MTRSTLCTVLALRTHTKYLGKKTYGCFFFPNANDCEKMEVVRALIRRYLIPYAEEYRRMLVNFFYSNRLTAALLFIYVDYLMFETRRKYYSQFWKNASRAITEHKTRARHIMAALSSTVRVNIRRCFAIFTSLYGLFFIQFTLFI